MAQFELAATERFQTGKEAARKIRSKKQIPAVFYGPKIGTVHLAVSAGDMQSILKKASLESVIIGLNIATGEGEVRKATAMLKELQVDPIKGDYLHADFYEISMDEEVTVDIPINLVGEPVGVTKGGILQYVRREITVSCLPGKLMDQLDIDVSHLDIGEAVHIEDIPLPEGVSTAQEGHLTVAVVAAPSISEEVMPEEGALEEEGAPEAEGGDEEGAGGEPVE
ncbi:MAG: 50S ribosomal protein L25 [Desulfobacteraceae bacterium]